MPRDVWSNDEAGAAEYARMDADGYDPDRPSRAEADAWAAEDRKALEQRRRADAAARERGEFVPDDDQRWTRLVLEAKFREQKTSAQVVSVALDVFRVIGPPTLGKHPLIDVLKDEGFEVKIVEGVVWVKGRLKDEGPPF